MIKTYFRVLAVTGMVMLFTACSSNQQVSHYLLQAPELKELANATQLNPRIVIGNVEVAPFLNGSGVVQERARMTLHQANYHRWAEPLPSQLQRQLRLGLQQQLPGATWLSIHGSAHLRSLDYRLDMSVDRFHLLANGETAVSGQWQLRNAEQGFVSAGQFSAQHPLNSDGYGAVVNSLQLAWAESLQHIALALSDALLNDSPQAGE